MVGPAEHANTRFPLLERDLADTFTGLRVGGRPYTHERGGNKDRRPGGFFHVCQLFLRRYYVLFFVEHASRRVCLAGCTSSPDGGWPPQQACNFGLSFAEQQTRFLIRDRDSKYPSPFDAVFRSELISNECCASASTMTTARGPIPCSTSTRQMPTRPRRRSHPSARLAVATGSAGSSTSATEPRHETRRWPSR